MNNIKVYDDFKVIDLINNASPRDFGNKDWINQPDFFKHVLSNVDFEASQDELFLEFGVFTGYTFRIIRDILPQQFKLYGFDAFHLGLPQKWESPTGTLHMEKGAFAQAQKPDLPINSEYVDGYVEDTVMPFLETHPQKIRFVHLDLDLYESTKYVLNAIKHRFVDGTIIILDDFYKLDGWEEFSYKAFSELFDALSTKFNIIPITTIGWQDGWAAVAFQLRTRQHSDVTIIPNKKVTIVTGLWDLGRGNMDSWAKRDFQEYKERFLQMLAADVPMCIWIPRELEEDVWKIRKPHNTKIYYKEVEDFKTWFPFFDAHETIRTNPDWYNIAPWLPGSPQAALSHYNPMMMTKMFMVNDSALYNPFDSEYFYWIDGGLTHTVPQGYFISGTIFQNIAQTYHDTIVHLAYPYEPNTEIHGFEKYKFFEYCDIPKDSTSVLISRGGFWGGPKDLIHQYNGVYYNILENTISNGYIGADECLFTIAAYQYPNLIERFQIENNGLVWPFFEAMQNIETFVRPKRSIYSSTIESDCKSSVYVLGFNSPKQFAMVCESFELGDRTFLDHPRKILINNSTDESTFDEYDQLCSKYGFEEIHLNNLGVCGGRQFVAEHFNRSDSDFYMFFEDDMFINDSSVSSERCKVGLPKFVPNLYNVLHKIMMKENFDFLKFSFAEFYGDNSVQWAWYNVPQSFRQQHWPDYNKLPEHGFDPNAPKTVFKNVGIVDGVAYIDGEIYYSNWPQIVSRRGNQKMFINTTWTHPFEQTWMSYMFQETINGNLHPAILLASPVTHDRVVFYPAEERREN